MSDHERVVKVAVIGSGLAGLTTASLLVSANKHPGAHGVHFDVHLFEKVPLYLRDVVPELVD